MNSTHRRIAETQPRAPESSVPASSAALVRIQHALRTGDTAAFARWLSRLGVSWAHLSAVLAASQIADNPKPPSQAPVSREESRS